MSVLRVLVALDPADPRREVLDAAVSLGRGTQMELEGLFIEDAEILRLGELPFAKEVTHSIVRSPRTGDLERQIRAQATLVRRVFESAARELGIRHSFHVIRGEVIGGLEQRACEFDLVVVGKASRRGTQRSWLGKAVHRLATPTSQTIVFVQDKWRTGSSVLVYPDGAGKSSAALQLAASIAAADDLQLVILGAAGNHDEDPPFIEDLPVDATRVRFRELASLDTDSLAAAVIAEDARALVLARHLPSLDLEGIATLLDRTESSLILITNQTQRNGEPNPSPKLGRTTE